MAAIYSKRLAAGAQASGTNSVVYTVPSDTTTVIRTISLTPTGTGTTEMLCNLNGVAIIFGGVGSAQYISTITNLRAVLNAGDEIQMQSLEGGFEYFLSGYELSD